MKNLTYLLTIFDPVEDSVRQRFFETLEDVSEYANIKQSEIEHGLSWTINVIHGTVVMIENFDGSDYHKVIQGNI
jgi:hypothetical protein